jgi:hypothetical protein
VKGDLIGGAPPAPTPTFWVPSGSQKIFHSFSAPGGRLPIPRNTAPTIYAPLLPRGSEANTLRTSDWDMPNCRAILDGVMPASKAARTALTCPRANETFVNSARRLSFDDDRSGSTGGFGLTLGGNLPRRFASSTDAVISRSNSISVRCLTAVDRSLGRTCRCEVLSAAVVAAETSGKEAFWANWVENRSAVGG